MKVLWNFFGMGNTVNNISFLGISVSKNDSFDSSFATIESISSHLKFVLKLSLKYKSLDHPPLN